MKILHFSTKFVLTSHKFHYITLTRIQIYSHSLWRQPFGCQQLCHITHSAVLHKPTNRTFHVPPSPLFPPPPPTIQTGHMVDLKIILQHLLNSH